MCAPGQKVNAGVGLVATPRPLAPKPDIAVNIGVKLVLREERGDEAFKFVPDVAVVGGFLPEASKDVLNRLFHEPAAFCPGPAWNSRVMTTEVLGTATREKRFRWGRRPYCRGFAKLRTPPSSPRL